MRHAILFGLLASLNVLASFGASVSLTIKEPDGIGGGIESVTAGVPFPKGALKDTGSLRLWDGTHEVPLQASASATWNDGSIKWVLLDFRTCIEARQSKILTLNYGQLAGRTNQPRVMVREFAGGVEIDTGALRFTAAKTNAAIVQDLLADLDGNGRLDAGEKTALGLNVTMTLTNGAVFRALPPESIRLETAGPERTGIRISGWLGCADEPVHPFMQYVWRLQARVGSPELQAELTVINLDPTNRISMVRTYGVDIPLGQRDGATPATVIFGEEMGTRPDSLSGAESARLLQLTEGDYVLKKSSTGRKGIRAPGWLVWQQGDARALIVVRDFWQQYPIGLRSDGSQAGLEFYAAEAAEPFDWDRGLAKTHEFVINFDRAACNPTSAAEKSQRLSRPLVTTAPIQWYCDSKVFGDVAPFDFDLFPDYETLVEASGDKLVQSMATGIRNWGDFYYGGPYKGKNSYVNLEYDVPHNCIVQFARTGQRKYFDLARTMARHQADIDVNHFTGWQWKHSPRHTETQAEFGHTFTRGLLEHYFLTGDRRSLDAATELGDFFAKDFQNPRSLGNERQIGWGLISLLPVYEATWDRKYLEAVNKTLDRLLQGLEPKGKFEIRWDNRIAFFNGIAATGLIYVHRATGDERVAEAAMRVIGRTKGFYPEYAGRTLEALAWAYQRSKDPEYLDLLKLTYETTQARALAWRDLDLGAGTIFTVHALPWLEASGLTRRPPEPLALSADEFASDNGLHAHHMPAAEAEIYLGQQDGVAPGRIVMVRKGAWKGPGEAILLGAAGNEVARVDFPTEATAWQRKSLALPSDASGTFLLKLRSPPAPSPRGGSMITWDVITSRAMQAVFSTPRFEGLQYVTPALFAVPQAGATNIVLTLIGEGEGFKKAVLRNPDGQAVATLARFIDLDDKGRYEYTISAPVPDAHQEGIWSITLQDVAITSATGLCPYFSSTRAGFFRPHTATKAK